MSDNCLGEWLEEKAIKFRKEDIDQGIKFKLLV